MNINDLKKEFKTISQYENIFLQKGKAEKKKFQRLEFLGDKVLGLILSSLLFDKYINFTEGMLSRTVSHLCSGRVLYKIARDIKLDLYFKEKKKNISEKGLADSLEVIIGAFYLNNGFEKTKNMIDLLWRGKFSNINHLKADNKTLLQEWSQSRKLGLPKYSIIKKTGPDHSPSFAVKVEITNCRSKKGVGKTVQDAQQDAAGQFLKNIKN
jgi:ribonuclease-3